MFVCELFSGFLFEDDVSDSAKVSESGVGGTWYHGTPYAFKDFDVNAGEFDSEHETPAIFLTNDPDLAESYASRERQPMGDVINDGRMKKEFIYPAREIILKSNSPYAEMLSDISYCEKLFGYGGKLNNDVIYKELSDVAPLLKKLVAKYEGMDRESYTTAGANIRPCRITGSFMHVTMLRDFNAAWYDLFMRKAKEAGLSGVLFKNIVDSPSGGGEPADVLAVFDPKNIHPKFGK